MSGRIFSRTVALLAAIVMSAVWSGAQTYSSFTPYSSFAIGDLHKLGSTYNRTMGGTGIAGRNNYYLNIMNPAAVSARDTLSVLIDYSMYQDNKYFRQGGMKGAGNTFNIGDLAVSFPIWKTAAMMVGIQPYSATGYGYRYAVEDPEVIGRTGNITYSALGRGGLYQAFAGAGVTFWRRFSVGAQVNYIFGQIARSYKETFELASFNGAQNGYTLQLKGINGKFGFQYAQPISGKAKLTLGATYTMKTPLKGFVEGFKYSSGSAATDTLYHKVDTLVGSPANPYLASEIGVGVNFRYDDKWCAEIDFTMSDWTGSRMASTPGFMGNAVTTATHSSFAATSSRSIRAGFEYTPNRNDIRYYFKKCSYRIGGYYRNEYYKLDGRDVNTAALTFGVTLPITRQDGLRGNGITLGMELGQRGSLAGNLIRERFINFTFGFNMYDIWFLKPKYN